MYLISVSALFDNDLSLLPDGRQAMVVRPVNSMLPIDVRNVHGLGLKSILVTHHQGGFITPIPPGNSQCVRRARFKSACRALLRTVWNA